MTAMTDRAKALRGAVAAAVGPGKVDVVLRAVVEELGVTEATVERLRLQLYASEDPAVVALAALLEAAGADR